MYLILNDRTVYNLKVITYFCRYDWRNSDNKKDYYYVRFILNEHTYDHPFKTKEERDRCFQEILMGLGLDKKIIYFNEKIEDTIPIKDINLEQNNNI